VSENILLCQTYHSFNEQCQVVKPQTDRLIKDVILNTKRQPSPVKGGADG